MDILAHMLWANYGTIGINEKREKSGKEKINKPWTIFWSVFPDLFAFGIPTIIAIATSIFAGSFNTKLLFTHHGAPNFLMIDLPSYLYQFSHSLIIWSLVFVLVSLLMKKKPLVMLGWLLHILLDIFSHSLAFYPTPFLFPISNYHFPYAIRWSDKYFMIINYSLIIFVGIWLYLRNKKYLLKK